MTQTKMPGPLMLDLEGLSMSTTERERLAHTCVGGVILFARNYENRQQLRQLVQEVRSIRPELIIAVDQEGGRVQRFREDFTRLPAMRRLGEVYHDNKQAGLRLAKEVGWLMAAELLCEDIDISFAPVLDIDYGIASVIGDRSFSKNQDALIALSDSFMAGMHEAGMATTGKHFPGHGGVEADSHVAVPVDHRSLDVLRSADMHVFKSLAHHMDGVMPAHVIYPDIDEKPAGFSPIWMRMLREECAFQGVIFSDDLTMEGASVAGSFSQRAKAAMDAGCDMVLVCNHPEGAEQVIDYFNDEPAPSNQRLLRMKHARTSPATWQQLQKYVRWQAAAADIKTLTA